MRRIFAVLGALYALAFICMPSAAAAKAVSDTTYFSDVQNCANGNTRWVAHHLFHIGNDHYECEITYQCNGAIKQSADCYRLYRIGDTVSSWQGVLYQFTYTNAPGGEIARIEGRMPGGLLVERFTLYDYETLTWVFEIAPFGGGGFSMIPPVEKNPVGTDFAHMVAALGEYPTLDR